MRLGDAAGPLTWSHPVSPLDPANFQARQGRPPSSCDRRLLECRRLLDRGDPAAPAGLVRTAMPDPRQLVATVEPDPFEDLVGFRWVNAETPEGGPYR